MPNEPLQFGLHYHIYNRGNNRENLFVEERNYPYFLKLYVRHILAVAVTYAYVLMPNHFHLLIRTRTVKEQEVYWRQQQQIGSVSKTEPISTIFKPRKPSRAFNNMFIAYARAFNKATGRTGVLFETPFHRKAVTDEAYFQRLISYIHRNPQEHGFVTDFRDWKWSSYAATLSAQASHLQRDEALEWFGGRQQFIEAHHRPVALEDEDLDWFNLPD